MNIIQHTQTLEFNSIIKHKGFIYPSTKVSGNAKINNSLNEFVNAVIESFSFLSASLVIPIDVNDTCWVDSMIVHKAIR